MKISEFCLATAGTLYAAHIENLPVMAIFGIIAFISFQRIMKGLEENY